MISRVQESTRYRRLLGQRHVNGVNRLACGGGVRRGPASLASLRVAVAVVLGGWFTLAHEGEPRARSFALARSDLEEDFLYALGDGAAAALADRDAVNASYGRDLGGSAREEQFVGDVQSGALNSRLDHRDCERATNLDDAVARDARKDGRRERRRNHLAVVH